MMTRLNEATEAQWDKANEEIRKKMLDDLKTKMKDIEEEESQDRYFWVDKEVGRKLILDGMTEFTEDEYSSDGGSSDYYKIPEWATELDDLIIYKKMPWPIANIFKACYRWGQKQGNTKMYEATKIGWFQQRLIQHLQEDRL